MIDVLEMGDMPQIYKDELVKAKYFGKAFGRFLDWIDDDTEAKKELQEGKFSTTAPQEANNNLKPFIAEEQKEADPCSQNKA